MSSVLEEEIHDQHITCSPHGQLVTLLRFMPLCYCRNARFLHKNNSSTRVEGGSLCSAPSPAVRLQARAEVRWRDTHQCPAAGASPMAEWHHRPPGSSGAAATHAIGMTKRQAHHTHEQYMLLCSRSTWYCVWVFFFSISQIVFI
jgi:hypothetical protein